jgi:hypothetical protein
VIVLNSSVLGAGVRQLYWNASATFVPVPQQNYRYLAGLIRKLAGFPGCCERKNFSSYRNQSVTGPSTLLSSVIFAHANIAIATATALL